MRKQVSIFIFFSFLFLYAQPSVVWVRQYNGGFDDFAHAVACDNEGNLVVTGASYNGTDFDCFTIKYSSNGDTVWTRRFDSGGSDFAQGIAVDSADNVIIVGSSCLDFIYDYLLIKYDSQGNFIWMRRYQTNADNLANAVAVDYNQNIIVTGYSFNGLDYDYLTVKYTSSGDTIYSKRYDADFNDIADDIAVDIQGNIFVTGSAYDTVITYFSTHTIKYDSTGNTLWVKNYDYCYGRGVAVDYADNVIVVGSPEYSTGPSGFDVIKYTSSGDSIWSFHDAWYEYFLLRDVAVDTDNNIYITGGHNRRYEVFDFNFGTCKFSSNGDSLWWIKYPEDPDSLDEYSNGVTVDVWDDIIVTGYGDNGSDFDYLTVKYSEGGSIAETGNKQIFSQGLQLNMPYPNPFDRHTSISYKVPEHSPCVDISICNAVGQKVKQFTNLRPSINQISWHGDDDSGRQVSAGVYFVRMTTACESMTRKLVKLR
jgi:hypothetical protein